MATAVYTLIEKYNRKKDQQNAGDDFKMAVPRDAQNLHYRNDLAVGLSEWTAYNRRVFGLFTLAPIEEGGFIGIWTGVNTIEERLDKSFSSPNVTLPFKDSTGVESQVHLDLQNALPSLRQDVDRYSASLPIPVTMAPSGSALTNDVWPHTPVQHNQVFSVLHRVVSSPRLVFHTSFNKEVKFIEE